MKTPLVKKIQLWIVFQIINLQNLILEFFRKILFTKLKKTPENILIFKVGNIGDIICAVPAIVAIRKAFPFAKITLLTSPGKKGAVGAKELLSGVWYIDELMVYYSKDITSRQYRKNLIKKLKDKKVDLFVQLPDDWINFKMLFRNLIFAKLTGSKSAFGFRVRTFLNLFRKTQIDYLIEKREVDFLLDLLKSNNIRTDKAELIFNITSESQKKAEYLIEEKFGGIGGLIIGICPGGKSVEKRWPVERFGAVAKYLEEKYNAKFIIFGGPEDTDAAEIIKNSVREDNVLIAINKIELIENFAMLKKCDFLLTNDTGIMHIAVAVEKPVIALFSIRNTLGKWFPYGNQHKILYHRFLNCDYRKIECMKKSIEMISVEEVINACDAVLGLRR